MPAIEFKLLPALSASADITLPPADAAEFLVKAQETIGFMHSAMYVVMFVIFVYMILSVFKREENEIYQP
jgi:hypothetical protein